MTPEQEQYSAQLQSETEGLTVLPSEQVKLDETPVSELQPAPVQAESATPPTGETSVETAPTPESTDSDKIEYSGETVDYGGKQVPIEDVEYVNNIFGQKIPFLKTDKAKEEVAATQEERNTRVSDMAAQVRERMSAPGQGLMDGAVDFIDWVLPGDQQDWKPSKYEDEVAQTTRQISAIVLPQLAGQGALMQAGKAANAKVGWSIGQNRFIQWLGNRGVEALSSVAVGAVSKEYEEASVRSTLPKWMDWTGLTTEAGGPDTNRWHNIQDDLGMMMAVPMFGRASRSIWNTIMLQGLKTPIPLPAAKGLTEAVTQGLDSKIIAQTPEGDAALRALAPESPIEMQARAIYEGDSAALKWEDLGPEQKQNLTEYYRLEGDLTVDPDLAELSATAVKQLDDMKELGSYNTAINVDQGVTLKGVQDLYEWNETGLRQLDDFGIVSASVDAARINKNAGTTYGRLSSVISAPAVRYVAANPLSEDVIIKGLTQQLTAPGKIAAKGPGWAVTSKEIRQAGENVVLQATDPLASPERITQLIEPLSITTESGDIMMVDAGFGAFYGLPPGMSSAAAKASAYLQTSLAGQISDVAEGIRINKTSRAALNAQDNMIDRMITLQKLSAENGYFMTAKAGIIDGTTSPEALNVETIKNVKQSLHDEAIKFGESMKWFKENEPEMLDAFQELYELSDGALDDINKINKDIYNSFGRYRVLWDENPGEASNMMVGAIRANWRNSILGSSSSSTNALYGNIGGIIEQPLSYFAGALMRRDLKGIQDGWMAYSAIWDTQRKALPFGAKMFRKASQNAQEIAGEFRADLMVAKEEKIAAFRKIADVRAKQGDTSLGQLLDQYETLQSLADDPVFRLVPNTFTGFDGWAKSTMANTEARFRATQALRDNGSKITREEVKRLADIEYNSMFDSQGLLLKDEAVKYKADEVALNLDTELGRGMDALNKKVPIIGMFNMFPKMMGNIGKQLDDYAPYSVFQKDIRELTVKPLKFWEQHPEMMDDLLRTRKFDPDMLTDSQKLQEISKLKSRAMGKKAIGGMMAVALSNDILQDRFTGDGLYDKEIQNSRIKNSNWKRRTYKFSDGRVIEYEKILGPGLSNWLATYVNIHDNFDRIGEANFENLREKMTFILSASVTDQMGVSALSPLMEMLSGNSYQFERFAANMVNGITPLAGLRKDAMKLLNPGLQVVDADFQSMLSNKNNWMSQVGRQPYLYNPVTGKVPNDYSMITRVYNMFSPVAVHPAMSDNQKFLFDLDYDYSTTAKTIDGIKLPEWGRSEIQRLMTEDGYFANSLKELRRGSGATNTLLEIEALRNEGLDSEVVSVKDYNKLFNQVHTAHKEAERRAFEIASPELKAFIQEEQIKRAQIQRANEAADPDALRKLQQFR